MHAPAVVAPTSSTPAVAVAAYQHKPMHLLHVHMHYVAASLQPGIMGCVDSLLPLNN